MAIFILAPDPNGTCCDCSARANVCDACSGPACSCDLIIPTLNGAYAYPRYNNQAAAQAAINSQIVNCIGYFGNQNHSGVGLSSLTADNSTDNVLTLAGTSAYVLGPSNTIFMAADATIQPASTISVNWNIAENNQSIIQLYSCNGAFITGLDISDSDVGSSAFTPGCFPQSGEYVFYVWGTRGTTAAVVASTTFSSDKTMIINPVDAEFYDNPRDSTTVYKLPACPRTIIPLFAGTYADKATAQAILSSSFVTSCFMAGTNDINNGTASSNTRTADATSLSASITSSSAQICSTSTIMSFYFEGGSTFSINGSITLVGTTQSWSIRLANSDGSTYQSLGGGSSSATVNTSFTFPNPGLYYLQAVTDAREPFGGPYSAKEASISLSFSSTSTTFGANKIQAIYDNGTNCSSRLDC